MGKSGIGVERESLVDLGLGSREVPEDEIR